MVCLTAKSVQSAALSLQSVHHIHGCHSLSLGVLGVCHSITNHVLKKNFKNTTGLLVDEAGLIPTRVFELWQLSERY